MDASYSEASVGAGGGSDLGLMARSGPTGTALISKLPSVALTGGVGAGWFC